MKRIVLFSLNIVFKKYIYIKLFVIIIVRVYYISWHLILINYEMYTILIIN